MTAPLAVRVAGTKRGSWHLADTIYSQRTYCGRVPGQAYLSEVPGDERTCERCSVIAVKRAQRAAA